MHVRVFLRLWLSLDPSSRHQLMVWQWRPVEQVTLVGRYTAFQLLGTRSLHSMEITT